MSTLGADLWYAGGLAFACKGCGRCCRGPGGYVWITEADALRLAETLKLSADDFGRRYLRKSGNRLALVDNERGDCVFLDEKGRCQLYDARPVQCATFPWWPEVVRTEQHWRNESRRCPGIGEGPSVPAEEILRQLARNTE